jgi:hypothetical protein
VALLAPRDAEGTYARRENQAVNQAGRMVVGRLFARPLGGWYRGAWRRRSFSSDGDVYDDLCANPRSQFSWGGFLSHAPRALGVMAASAAATMACAAGPAGVTASCDAIHPRVSVSFKKGFNLQCKGTC